MSEVSIKKNFVYKSTLTISTYLMNFVTFPYVARVLGVDGIGLVSFVDNAINYFLLFATMGISILGTREIAAVKDDKEKCDQIFANILGLNLLFTVATIIIYLFCVNTISKFQQYDELFYIGTAKILFTAFLVEWFYTGIENFRYITLRSLLVKLLYVIAVFVFIQSKEDYKLYFVLTVATVVVNAIVNMIYVRRYVRLKLENLVSKGYIKQNISLGIYTLMTSMYITFNVMFLGFASGNVEVGYYTTAFKLYSVILGLFAAFTNVMLPRMSSLLANGNKEQFQLMISKSFSLMAFFSIPMIMCSMALAPQIIYVLSGSGYEGAILPMRIIMPAALFVGIAQVLAMQVITPMKQDRILLLASILGASVSILINIFIVPYLHSIGSAIVLLASECIVTSTYIVYVIRAKCVFLHPKILLESLLCAIPSGLICLLCNLIISNNYVSLLVGFFSSIVSWLIMCHLTKNNIIALIVKRKL